MLLQRRGTVPSDHPQSVTTTFSLAFERVQQKNEAAIELLHLCAFLTPDAIPLELITQGAVHLGTVLKGVAADTLELVRTGTMTFYHDLCMQSLPNGARALMGVEHVGPHVAMCLYEELGVDTPEKLLRAAQKQRIRELPGFGERSESRLAETSASYLNRDQSEQLAGVA